MLSSKRSILIYGRAPELLQTRQWLLERTGADVWMANELSDFDQIRPGASVDVVVLCHTLSPAERALAWASATSRWPEIQSLVLTSGRRDDDSAPSDETADIRRGPAHLLDRVTSLLTVAKHP